MLRKLVCLLIRGYQTLVSPFFGRTCRYYPTCSQYALEAITKYGVVRGGLKAVWRVLRCNPFSKGGYDPVR